MLCPVKMKTDAEPAPERRWFEDENLPPGYRGYKQDDTAFLMSKKKDKDINQKVDSDRFLTPGGKVIRNRQGLLNHAINIGMPDAHIELIRKGLAKDGFVSDASLPMNWGVKPSKNSHRYNHFYVTEKGETMRGKAAVIRHLRDLKDAAKDATDAEAEAAAEKNFRTFLNSTDDRQCTSGKLRVQGLPAGWEVRRSNSKPMLVISESGVVYISELVAIKQMAKIGVIKQEDMARLAQRMRQAVGRGAPGGFGVKSGWKMRTVRVDIEALGGRQAGRRARNDSGETMQGTEGIMGEEGRGEEDMDVEEEQRSKEEEVKSGGVDVMEEDGDEQTGADGHENQMDSVEVGNKDGSVSGVREGLDIKLFWEAYENMDEETMERLGKALEHNPGLVVSIAGGVLIRELFVNIGGETGWTIDRVHSHLPSLTVTVCPE